MSNLTPDDIERMDAAWDAIDAGLAKGDPRFAGYLATRARARLTPQITKRSGPMDDTQSSLLLESLGQLLQALKAQTAALGAIAATLGGINENIEAGGNLLSENLDTLNETLAEKLELLGDAARDQSEAARGGFDLLRLEMRNVGGEINALRTSDR